MSNARQVTQADAKDMLATRFDAEFAAAEYSGSPTSIARASYATSVTLVGGEQPSSAFVAIPIAGREWDEQAPTVALRPDGPVGRIPLKSRCRIILRKAGSRNAYTVLSGSVVEFRHQIATDSAVALVFDDRWLLSKVTVFGRAVYDPASERSYFDSGTDCIFNEMGWPNCLDTPYGPMFAPSWRYGYKSQSDYTEPAQGAATARARSWTVQDVIDYLRNLHYSGTSFPVSSVYVGSNKVSAWVGWSKSASQMLGSNRTVQNFSLQNTTLLRALQQTARRAGPYDLYIRPGAFGSSLQFVRMDPLDGAGSGLLLPSYTGDEVGALANNSSVILDGEVVESAINYFDNTLIVGDPICIERFLSTSNSGTTTTSDEGDNGLEAAWSSDRYDAFIDYVANQDPQPNTKEAVERAFLLYPEVFSAYRVKNGYDLWQTTKWSGAGNAPPHPRVRPNLLTGTNVGGDTNPTTWEPLPFIVEYENTDGAGDWVPFQDRFTGVRLSPDGQMLFLDNLRDQNVTWYNEATDPWDFSDATKIKQRNIRMSIAVEGDFPLQAFAADDPNGAGTRVSGSPQFTYVVAAKQGDYMEWLRSDSHPNGRELVAAAFDNYEDRKSGGSELFTDEARQEAHAVHRQRDVRRVEHRGSLILPGVNASVHPGVAVSVEGGLPVYSVVKSVTYNAHEQVTIVELTSADREQIYDAPMPQAGLSASSYSGGSGGGGGKDSSGDEGYNDAAAKPTAEMDDYERSAAGLPSRSAPGGWRPSMQQAAPEKSESAPRKSQIKSADQLNAEDAALARFGDETKGISSENAVRGDAEIIEWRNRQGFQKNNQDFRDKYTGDILPEYETSVERSRRIRGLREK
jgi:hypothetical protein